MPPERINISCKQHGKNKFCPHTVFQIFFCNFFMTNFLLIFIDTIIRSLKKKDVKISVKLHQLSEVCLVALIPTDLDQIRTSKLHSLNSKNQNCKTKIFQYYSSSQKVSVIFFSKVNFFIHVLFMCCFRKITKNHCPQCIKSMTLLTAIMKPSMKIKRCLAYFQCVFKMLNEF